MPLIRAYDRFWYIECDDPNCNRKIEHLEEKLLKQVAELSGWKRRGDQRLCPECAGKLSERVERMKRR